MKTKRQTIWLVSMLSLMVVLSAYYLFTEDVSKLEFTTTGSTVTELAGTQATREINGLSAKDVVIHTNDLNVKPAESQTTPKATATTQSGSVTTPAPSVKQQPVAQANPTAPATPVKAASPNPDPSITKPVTQTKETVNDADAKVLKQVMTQAKSGSDYFAGLGLKRNEELAKLTEKWMTILADPKQSATAAADAEAELQKLRDNEAKVTNLEDVLMMEFPQAVITEESSKWRVTVQSNKLEKSQAVSIIDRVMSELNVGADKIVVQFVP
jgi:stage III sporulation protein AH